MTVGVIGAGNIGATVARLAVAAGHSVVIANSRGPDSLKDLVTKLGPKARAGTAAEAIAQGDIVVVAIPFRDRDDLFKSSVDFSGKIVVDAMNPYTTDFKLMDLGGLGSAEVVASELPGARVVKAFNTLYYETLDSSARPKGSPERIVLPLAGDDAEAKRTVSSFIDSVGYDPLDLGTLVDGRKQEPGSPYSKPLSLAQAKALAT
jgi:predicted dinucleotide-binding enzyme